MALSKLLKKTAYWTAVFLGMVTIGIPALSNGYQGEGNSGSPGTLNTERTGNSRDIPANPGATLPEKVADLTIDQAARPLPKGTRPVIASWYGPKHHHKLTANGQRFNMYKNTLAHRTLPMGTKVRLVNFKNGKSSEGIVNDRGPHRKGRDIDVSYSMARQLGLVQKGVAKLYMDIIGG